MAHGNQRIAPDSHSMIMTVILLTLIMMPRAALAGWVDYYPSVCQGGGQYTNWPGLLPVPSITAYYGHVWALGCNRQGPGGFYLPILHSGWLYSGLAKAISSGPYGDPIHLGSSGGNPAYSIPYSFTSTGAWSPMPTTSMDGTCFFAIAGSADGYSSVYALASDCSTNYPDDKTDLPILRWDPYGRQWRGTTPDGSMLGKAISIAVSPEGVLWAVNASGTAMRLARNYSAWVPLPGCVRKVAVGSNDNAWALGCEFDWASRGYPIYHWFITPLGTWQITTGLPGRALDIAIEFPSQTVWIINTNWRVQEWE